MPGLQIQVETPDSFAAIDFAAMANFYGRPVDVITDIEGTVAQWSWRASHSAIAPEAIEAIALAHQADALAGAHAITNRAGRGGKTLVDLFNRTVTKISPDLLGLGAHPSSVTSRSERKPSGVMSTRIIEELNSKGRRASSLVVAFVGDKPSDIMEANRLHVTLDVPVVGFMVPRYGDRDHPLDAFFGKRRKAISARESLQPGPYGKMFVK